MPSVNFSGRYRSSGDASMRHSNTYIAIVDPVTGIKAPYYVEEVGGDRSNPTLTVSSMEGHTRSCNVGDPDVIMERPTIGMVNYRCPSTRRLFAVWHESLASRQIKRSLDFNLINVTVLRQYEIEHFTNCRPNRDNAFNRKVATKTFYNKEYPSYSESLESIVTGINYSCAFGERFALCVHPDAGIVLYYKTLIVGYVSDTHPILLEPFQYLQEQLEEAANGYV